MQTRPCLLAPMVAENTESAFWDINVAFKHRKLPTCSDSAMRNTDELSRNKEPVKLRAKFCTWAEASCVATATNLATQQGQCCGKIDLAGESPSGRI